jgi:hypothetical protein
MSSRMLLESFLVSARLAVVGSLFSDSSCGEYSACSFPALSSDGAYSLRSEFSLATLARRLLSVLVLLCSVLVRRLSVGDEEMWGRGWSRLERFDCRRRGGGRGGGFELVLLSFDTTREVLRFDEMLDVRCTPVTGAAGSESMVLRRDWVGPCVGVAVRTEVERWSSEFEELALKELMSVNRTPCRERGGGGGGFGFD